MSEVRETAIHHLAFRMDQSVPICDTDMLPGDELSLSDERINCLACRRIVGLGEPDVDADAGDDELDSQADRYIQEILEEGS